ncbi:MAG: hypothetical protein KF817_00745 [Phycisphaeraceae bacterium]|nr:hypothetical protein [Phycisphaeraceae bacterium]
MPSNYNSPFATPFKSACNRGVSYNAAVLNIANRYGVTVNKVWESLYKSGCCQRQKFNGQWIYFPTTWTKKNLTTSKNAQCSTWQNFIEWCLATGVCTPHTLYNASGTQSAFMKSCRNWWNRQYTGTIATTRTRSTVGSGKSVRTTVNGTKNRTRTGTTRRTTTSLKFAGRPVRRAA